MPKKITQSYKQNSFILLFDRRKIAELIKKALLDNEFESLEDYAFEFHAPSNHAEYQEYHLITNAISVSLKLMNSKNAINDLIELIDILQSNDDAEKINSTLASKYGWIDYEEDINEILLKYIKEKENDR